MRDFPAALRRHFDEPGCVGEPRGGADRIGEARHPVCGDHLVLYLQVVEGRVQAAGFRARGCPATLASGSAVCAVLPGLAADAGLPDEARRCFEEAYGAPKPAHAHALALVSTALRDALAG
jgi:hypothetical protein